MSCPIEKRVYTWKVDGVEFTRVFLLGNYDHTLTQYRQMIAIGKGDFPTVKDGDIEIGTVVVSSIIKGFSLVTFKLPSWCGRVEAETKGYKYFDEIEFGY